MVANTSQSFEDFVATQAPQPEAAPYGGGSATMALRDPRFIQDVRDEARRRGKNVGTWTDEQVVEWFYSDRSWADLNTVGAITDAARARGMDVEARERANRLQQVWQQLPGFLSEGGRGVAAVPDIATSLLADPLNVLPVASGFGKAATVARTARLAGQTGGQATRQALKSGVGRAALAEGGLSAGVEAGTDVAHQVRDVELGLQDGYSPGQTVASAAIGGAIGAGAGGLLGIPAALAGSRQGQAIVEGLRAGGMPDEEIARLSAREINRLLTSPQAMGDYISDNPAREEAVAARRAAEAEANAPPPPVEEPPAEPLITPSPDQLIAERLENLYRTQQGAWDSIRADPEVDADTRAEAMNALNRIAMLRDYPARMAAEGETIRTLAASEDPKKRAEAARRRQLYEQDGADFRTLFDGYDDEADEVAIARLIARSKVLPAAPEAPSATGPAQPTQPQPAAEGAAAPAAEPEAAPATPEAPPAPEDAAAAPDVTAEEAAAATPATPEPEPTKVAKRRKAAAKAAAPEEAVTPEAAPEATVTEAVTPEAKTSAKVPDDLGGLEPDLQAAWMKVKITATARKRAIKAGLTPDDMPDVGSLPDGRIGDADVKQARKNVAAATKAAGGQPRQAPTEQAPADIEPEDEGSWDDLVIGENARRAAEGKGLRPVDLLGKGTGKDGRILLGDVRKAPIRQATAVGMQRGEAAGTIPDSLRWRALASGVDWRAAMGEKTDREAVAAVRQAIQRKAQDRTPDEYAARLQTAVSRAMQLAGEATDDLDEARSIVARLAQDEEFADFGDDLVDYYDMVIDEGDARGLIDDTAEAVEAPTFNTTEKKRVDRLAKTYQARSPNLTEAQARYMAQRDVVAERGAASDPKTLSRSAGGERTDRASEFTTAGRTARRTMSGAYEPAKVQTFLRRGIPTVKGGDYTVSSKNLYPSVSKFSSEEALLRAQTGENGGLVPFFVSGGEFVKRAGKPDARLKKGSVAWADGITKKLYESEELARFYRGERKTPDADGTTPTATPEAAAPAPKPKATRKPKSPAALKRSLEERAAGKTPAEEVPTTDAAGKVLIIRRKSDGQVRMLNPRTQSDATLRDLLGKESMDDWEVRYAPPDTPRSSQAKLQRAWEEIAAPDPEREAADRLVSPASPEPNTPDGPPPRHFRDVADETIELSEEELHDIAAGMPDQFAAEIRGLAGNAVPYGTLRQLAGFLEVRPWGMPTSTWVRGALGALYGAMDRAFPEGVMLPVVDRERSIQDLRRILARRSTDEIDAAAAFIGRLGGDRTVGPRFMQSGPDEGNSFITEGGAADDNAILLRPTDADQVPNLHVLLHEVGHWAYHNILTNRDRLEFWDAMAKYEGPDGLREDAIDARRPLGGRDATQKALDPTGYHAPSEMFADQFVVWATRRGNAAPLADETYWKRIKRYVQAIFDRYVKGIEIDPDLEPLFAKILPDDAQAAEMRMRKPRDPQSPEGKAVLKRIEQLRMDLDGLRSAFASDNDESVILAHRELARTLAGLGQTKGRGAGPLKAVRSLLDPIVRSRLEDINRIMAQRAQVGGVDFTDDNWSFSILDTDGQIDAAEILRDFWGNGYDGRWQPPGGVPPQISQHGMQYTSLRLSLGQVYNALESAYKGAEDGFDPPGHKPQEAIDSLAARDPEKSKARKKWRKARKERLDAATEAVAEKTTKTPRKNRQRKPDVEITDNNADLKSMSVAKLREEFRKTRSSPRGDQAAFVLGEKLRARKLPAKAVEVERRFVEMGQADLEKAHLDAVHAGDKGLISQTEWELTRRAAKKAGDPRATKPTIRVMKSATRQAIDQERADSAGLMTADGIPPQARGFIREALGFIAHKDPDAQYVARTLAYRMFNVVGAAARETVEGVRVMGTEDVGRMLGFDIGAANGVYVDPSSPGFKRFRATMRNGAIGLTRGGAGPDTVIHEIGHALVQTRALPDEEIAGIVEAYRLADGATKERVTRDYAGAYRDMGDGEREVALAKEWFNEEMVRFMGERVARGDIYAQIQEGRWQDVRMRGAFDRAIDRFVEYMAYLVNGLVGRDDIKQQFRRLMFYGDMFETPSSTPPRRAVVPAELAAEHAHQVWKQAPRTRQRAVMDFVGSSQTWRNPGSGLGVTNDIEPAVFHVRVPSLEGDIPNPDQIEAVAPNGPFGPGAYLYLNADEAVGIEGVQLDRDRMLELLADRVQGARQDEIDSIIDDIDRLHGLRMTQRVAPRTGAQPRWDEMRHLGDLQEAELEIEESLMRLGLGDLVNPTAVAPVYARLRNLARFDETAFYPSGDPFVETITNALADRNLVDYGRDFGGEQFDRDGGDFYLELIEAMARSGLPEEEARVALNDVLAELGYDGLTGTPRRESYGFRGVDDEAMEMFAGPEQRRAALAAEEAVETVVVFDPSNVRHIEHSSFLNAEPGVYYSKPIRPDATGAMARGMMDGTIDKPSDVSPSAIAELHEADGADPSLTGAMATLVRGKTLTRDEHQALMRRMNPAFLLKQQSTRMRDMGMHWIADRFVEHFPDTTQRFGATFHPIHKALNALPDADNWARGWARRASGGVGQAPPRSHVLISKAIRRGPDSDQWRNLTPEQRKVAQMVRTTFAEQLEALRRAGIYVGERTNYMPQIWRPEAIDRSAETRERFMRKMSAYLMDERTDAYQRGLADELPTEEQAREFAESMYRRFVSEETDGVFIPRVGGSRNPTSEHTDFARMIELDRFPEHQTALEEFLENDVDALTVKYLNGVARRLSHVEKFGTSSHVIYDYMHVADQGLRGIAKLLSTNQVVKRRVRGQSGGSEVLEYATETRMPFASEQAAYPFAEQVLAAHGSGGAPAARAMMMAQAKRDPRGYIPVGYTRRVDAIVAALDDFKGQKSDLTGEDMRFVEAANTAAMGKSAWGAPNWAHKTSQAMRAFQSVTLLGFTTLTSLGDPVLPLIRSGSFKSWLGGISKAAADPEYRDMIASTGVAFDNHVHGRMVDLYGPWSAKASNAFFNISGLTPWTNFQRKLAAATGFEAMKAEQRRAIKHASNPNSRQFRQARRFLTAHGLEDFLPGGRRGSETIEDAMQAGDDMVRAGVVYFTNKTLFTPNADDIPLWAQHPAGQVVFQLKSFPLEMGRLAGYALGEADKGNLGPIVAMASVGPAFGAFSLGVKDVVQMRGGEEDQEAALRKRNLAKMLGHDEEVHGNEQDFWGWYLEGALQMGGVGLLGDLLHGVSQQAENGAYGQVRVASLIGGPSAGTALAGVSVIGGLKDAAFGDPDANYKERAGLREVATRIPFVGGVRKWREGIVDAVAPEVDRGAGSWGSGGGGGWGSASAGW